MPRPTEISRADEGLDSGGLRTILEVCRLDFGSLRTNAADGDGRVNPAALDGLDGMDGLERRMCRAVERLERLAGTLNAVLGRAASRTAAEEAAEVLAREADHRIRNSLQTVASLLERQARQADDGARDALRLAAARVQAVAEIHATLHAAPNFGDAGPELDLGRYLGGLCTALGQVMGADGERRSLHVEVEPLALPPETAQQLGLIVTELATNALRHAFLPDRPGVVRVTGARRPDGRYDLSIADDGKGLPPGFDSRLRPTGLGLRLVNVLADQLRARLAVDGHAGACFTLTLPASMGAGAQASGKPV